MVFGTRARGGAFRRMSLATGAASAQPYPNRNITLLVPFPPGGATDTIARIIQDPMQKALGQTIVIENVGGAGGMICAARAARADADGYTFMIHQVALAAGMSLYPNLTFDAVKDFAPIGLINTAASALAAPASLPPKNFKELLAWMKEPGHTTKIGHPGVGSYGHLAGVLIAQEFGVKATQVPYRGAGPALVDLLSGQVDLESQSAIVSGPLIKSGKLKAYAIIGQQAVRRLAGPADAGRARLQETQHRFLAHAAGAGRHAASDRRQAERRAARGARRCQGAEELCRRRHG